MAAEKHVSRALCSPFLKCGVRRLSTIYRTKVTALNVAFCPADEASDLIFRLKHTLNYL